MERRHICQGEPKGLLSGDSVPSSMCDIEACLCLTPDTTNPHPLRLYLESHILSFPLLALLAPQLHLVFLQRMQMSISNKTVLVASVVYSLPSRKGTVI